MARLPIRTFSALRPLALGVCLASGCSVDVSGTAPKLDGSLSPGIAEPHADGGGPDPARADGGRDPGSDGGGALPDAQAGEDASSLPVDGAVPSPDASPASDGGDDSADGAVGEPEVPVTAPVYAGDYPDDPYGESYLPLPGVRGPDGAPRGYKLHVPPSFVQGTAVPVLFALHGEAHTGALFASYGAELIQVSDDLGFVLVIPNGTQSAPDSGSWNGGACCDAAARANVDDVAFVRAVLADVRTRLRPDRGRTYAAGFSGGGFLAYRLACEMSDVFAAVAVVAGGIGTPALSAIALPANTLFGRCAPSHPVSVLHVHGDADAFVPYAALDLATRFWANANGCGASAAPASVPMAMGASRCVSYSGCRSKTAVTACSVMGGGHCWFGSSSCGTGTAPNFAQHIGSNSDDLDTTRAVADFLAALPGR